MDRSQVVGVLMGGLSSEREVSLRTGENVLIALKSRGWNAVGIDVGSDAPAQLIAAGVDVVWLALHGRFGEDGCIQGMLEVMGIPYTGSGVYASAVAMDKLATKRLAESLGRDLITAKDWVYRAGEQPPNDVTFPVVVKPCVGGSTLGMQLVNEKEALLGALEEALSLHHEVLIEERIFGDEITVSVLDGVAMPVVRIIPDGGFFDFDAKYTKGKTVYEVPAVLPEAVTARAQKASENLYVAMGCEGLCRVDFIVRESDNVPVLLEINTLPGMTATSLSPKAAAVVGLSFEDLVERVLMTAHVMTPEV
jgi:D-alanine-D-alanine ligase